MPNDVAGLIEKREQLDREIETALVVERQSRLKAVKNMIKMYRFRLKDLKRVLSGVEGKMSGRGRKATKCMWCDSSLGG